MIGTAHTSARAGVVLAFGLNGGCIQLWNQGTQEMRRKLGANAIIELNNDRMIKAVCTYDAGGGSFCAFGVPAG